MRRCARCGGNILNDAERRVCLLCGEIYIELVPISSVFLEAFMTNEQVTDEPITPRAPKEVAAVRERVLAYIKANPSPPQQPAVRATSETCQAGHRDWRTTANGTRRCRECMRLWKRAYQQGDTR